MKLLICLLLLWRNTLVCHEAAVVLLNSVRRRHRRLGWHFFRIRRNFVLVFGGVMRENVAIYTHIITINIGCARGLFDATSCHSRYMVSPTIRSEPGLQTGGYHSLSGHTSSPGNMRGGAAAFVVIRPLRTRMQDILGT